MMKWVNEATVTNNSLFKFQSMLFLVFRILFKFLIFSILNKLGMNNPAANKEIERMKILVHNLVWTNQELGKYQLI